MLYNKCSYIEINSDRAGKEGRFMLKGKVAVVTGGTRGIGFQIVRKYLANGAKVVLFGSRQESVDRALQQLKEENASWD